MRADELIIFFVAALRLHQQRAGKLRGKRVSNRQCRHKYRAGTLLFIAETPQLSRNASDQDKDNRRTKPGPDWP
ncbi:hypothetical protein, partial [Klebsiella oxytoca]|uniref:hypothetical protein n=1 Tax=Klebsiella oxytoca TaxID=571 RepID=UPI0025913709